MGIEERLVKIEKQNRRFKLGFGLLFTVLMGSVLVGWGGHRSVAKMAKSKAYLLIGEDGETIVTMRQLHERVSALETKVVSEEEKKARQEQMEFEAQQLGEASPNC